jgi:hypothetical protein
MPLKLKSWTFLCIACLVLLDVKRGSCLFSYHQIVPMIDKGICVFDVDVDMILLG